MMRYFTYCCCLLIALAIVDAEEQQQVILQRKIGFVEHMPKLWLQCRHIGVYSIGKQKEFILTESLKGDSIPIRKYRYISEKLSQKQKYLIVYGEPGLVYTYPIIDDSVMVLASYGDETIRIYYPVNLVKKIIEKKRGQ